MSVFEKESEREREGASTKLKAKTMDISMLSVVGEKNTMTATIMNECGKCIMYIISLNNQSPSRGEQDPLAQRDKHNFQR